MPISVVINTYNAADVLEGTLKTLDGFDEIVVCDMESTDRTVEIARQYGCKIVSFPKADHKSAEPARTFAIQSASSEWVLVVDADEHVTPQLREHLYAHIQKSDAEAGLYIPRKNYHYGEYLKSSYPDYQLRFFRREGTVWPPYVHTFPTVQGEVSHLPAEREDLAFIHIESTTRKKIEKLNDYTDNEVVKRNIKNVTLAMLIFKPMWRFLRGYIFNGSIFYGKRGFIQAANNAYYMYVMLCKAYEKQLLDEVLKDERNKNNEK